MDITQLTIRLKKVRTRAYVYAKRKVVDMRAKANAVVKRAKRLIKISDMMINQKAKRSSKFWQRAGAEKQKTIKRLREQLRRSQDKFDAAIEKIARQERMITEMRKKILGVY